ncbi:MAG: hypothetical protein H0W39_00410 [Sphingomonas sp.]|nr:hypothetical protein [Sphingomonas sp.]
MSISGKQWVLAIAGMILVIPVAQFLGRTTAERANASDAARNPAVPSFAETEAIVSRQPSEGITEADFDQELLANLEAWTLERTAANAEKYWDAASVPQSLRQISGESVLVERYGHRLAVVRIRTGNTTPTAMIAGIDGQELVRIVCVDRSGANVSIAAGPCDAKIRQVFNN